MLVSVEFRCGFPGITGKFKCKIQRVGIFCKINYEIWKNSMMKNHGFVEACIKIEYLVERGVVVKCVCREVHLLKYGISSRK